MTQTRVKGSWGGWANGRVVELHDGTVWQQDEAYYEYRFAHQPNASVENGVMHVKGMKRPVKVRRIG
jgi:hypothetical protein